MDDAQIAAFFDQVTPDQFVTDTAFLMRRPSVGGFAAFLTEHHEMLRLSFASCDGQIHPIVAVADHTAVRYFKAEDGEPLADLVQRAADFSRAHRAGAMFVYKRVTAPVADRWVDVVYWLAGDRDEMHMVNYRQGYFEIDHQVLGACVETAIDRLPDGFHRILEY